MRAWDSYDARIRANTKTKAQRVALEDRILAALRDEGPLTTGAITKLCGPYYQTSRRRHGRNGYGDQPFEACPDCQCIETEQIDARYAGVKVRAILKGMERRGLVAMLEAPIPNNYGGNVWIGQSGSKTSGTNGGI